MRHLIIKTLRVLGLYQTIKIPAHIISNFRELNETDTAKLNDFIRNCKADSSFGAAEMENTLLSRLHNFRSRHMFFLDSTIGLKNKKILEIGCGTGSSSIAMAEQGAQVFGLDLDDKSLLVVQERAKLYGLEDKITVKKGNATTVDQLYESDSFDAVIFFASIEHMTYDERIDSLKAAWKVLKKGGHLCILGTPNRLWFHDPHTALLPFYFWLPDEIAFKYSKFSTREDFNQLYLRDYEKTREEFARWGRGVSFHELELAIKPVGQLKVAGDLHSFERPKTFLQRLSYKFTDEYKFKRVLAKNGPANAHPGFYEYYLDIAITKD
ncbi:MAG TPA: class I SAM-dependent methyltransferase [Chitinophagales bacterium]|nr:class I SAM-dependent methyltransferase [Chitinophagales bacterium]